MPFLLLNFKYKTLDIRKKKSCKLLVYRQKDAKSDEEKRYTTTFDHFTY